MPKGLSGAAAGSSASKGLRTTRRFLEGPRKAGMKSPSPLAGKALGSPPSGDTADRFVGESKGGVFGGGGQAGTPSGSERAWSLWKADDAAHAEIVKHPLGYEVRVHMNGRVLFSLVRPSRKLIELETEELKQAGLARGWTDRPPVPG